MVQLRVEALLAEALPAESQVMTEMGSLVVDRTWVETGETGMMSGALA